MRIDTSEMCDVLQCDLRAEHKSDLGNLFCPQHWNKYQADRSWLKVQIWPPAKKKEASKAKKRRARRTQLVRPNKWRPSEEELMSVRARFADGMERIRQERERGERV